MSFSYGISRDRNRERDDWDQVNNDWLSVQPKNNDQQQQIVPPNDASEKSADDIAQKVVDGEKVDLEKETAISSTVQRKDAMSGQEVPTPPDGFNNSLSSSKGGGQSLDSDTQLEMESKMGADFSGVKIHAGGMAAGMAEDINAKAFTHGNDIYFGQGQFSPGSKEGKTLLAHELVHTKQDAGNIQRTDKDDYPFIGYIANTELAALRSKAQIDQTDKYKGIDYDLPAGYEVTVLSMKNGFYYVKTKAPDNHKGVATGTIVYGYISRELVTKQAQELVDFDKELLTKDPVTLDEALLVMTSAKRFNAQKHKFTSYENGRITHAKEIIEKAKRYTVDLSTYTVKFNSSLGKVKIDTIEDFILFVEDVERTYPSASRKDVVSEIRQVWFSDPNWEMLVASQGITSTTNGKKTYEDIETNAVSKRYDMADLAPDLTDAEKKKDIVDSKSKVLSTRFGNVNISHVIAGLDAAFSGAPSAFPAQFLKDKGHEDSDNKTKYDALMKASGGTVTDFTTWSGDIGQAYGEYLCGKYIQKWSYSLDKYVKIKSSDDQLLADILGYVARQYWKSYPAENSATGNDSKVSDYLKTLFYSKTEGQAENSFRKYFEKITGKTGDNLKAYVKERSMSFARNWYAKKEKDARSGIGMAFSGDWGLEDLLKNFDNYHAKNVKEGGETNQIDVVVDHFMEMLDKPIK